MLGALKINGILQLVDGNQGVGKVLTSDADGKASWDVETTVSYCAQSWGAFKNLTNDAIMDIDFLRYSKGAKKGDYQVYDRIGHAYFDYTKWVKTDRWKNNLTAEDKAYSTQAAINRGGRVEDQFTGCQCDSGYKLVWTGGCSWGDCINESILPLPGNEVYFFTCAKV